MLSGSAGDPEPTCPLARGSGPRRARRLEAWTFVDDGTETSVSVPHTWNAEQTDGDPSTYDRGCKRYRTTVEPAAADTRRLLHFEGANQTATVHVDGDVVGTHRGGYTAFTVDVTDALTVGEQSAVEVTVDNTHDEDTPPLNADFTFFGGIYRPVWLVETGKIRLDGSEYGSTGVRVDTPEVSENTATIRVRTDITNHTASRESVDLTHRVLDDGTLVAEFGATVPLGSGADRTVEVDGRLEDPATWSPTEPNSYRVETTVAVDGDVTDAIASPLGVREIGLDSGRVTVDGDPVRLRGTNRHQDRPGRGNALSDADHREDVRRIANTGVNFLRLAHYPQSHTVLDAADEHGLLVWEEIPVVNLVTDSAAYRENCLTRLEEMVRQHYNHPSIGMWGFMNEILLGYDMDYFEGVDESDVAVARDLATTLDARLRSLDQTRLTAMACHGSPVYERFDFAEIPDVLGWNLYHGWYYGEVEYLPGVLFEKNATRPEQATTVSEYGVGADTRLHTADPQAVGFHRRVP